MVAFLNDIFDVLNAVVAFYVVFASITRLCLYPFARRAGHAGLDIDYLAQAYLSVVQPDVTSLR